MPVPTATPGTCHICKETLAGNRIRQHLLHCLESRTGLKAVRDPLRRGGRRTALKTAYLSVRSKEQPHWLELGVRCDATLHELDRFLRAVWLECCGHLSHFEIEGVVYSVMVPLPGERRRFEPMDEREAKWRHMGKSVNAAVPPLTSFSYEYDYGTPTGLELEHVAVFGGLVQALSPSQPWHGRKIVILARNDSMQACLSCGRPGSWKTLAEGDEYDDYDEELYEDEGVLSADDLDPITFCEECAPTEGEFVLLANSPRVGANCYDNVHSWLAWPLPEDDER